MVAELSRTAESCEVLLGQHNRAIPLLGEAEDALLDMVERAEQMVERFNDHVAFEVDFGPKPKKRSAQATAADRA